MFHIVGTNHELQHTGRPSRAPAEIVEEARGNLKSYLRRLADELSPKIMAEEFSQDALNRLSARDEVNVISHVKAVADELGIKHRFCDPSGSEREAIGVPSDGTENCPAAERRKYDALREAHWADALSDAEDQTVSFACGANHVSSFATLLRDRGVAVSVACAYFGKELYCTSQ